MNLPIKPLLLTIMVLTHLLSVSQKIDWSVDPKHNFGGFSKVLGENSDGVFVLHHKNNSLYKEFYIEKYNHSLSKSSSIKINIPKATLQKITVLEGKIDFITSVGKRVSGKKTFIFHSINTSNLKITKYKLLESNNFDFSDDKLAISFTNDKKSMAMVHCELTKEHRTRFVFTRLDSNRTIIPLGIFNTSYKPNNVTVSSVRTDNLGNVYLLANVRVKSRHPFKHILIVLNSQNGQIKETVINNKRTYLSQVNIHHDREKKQMQVVGLYGSTSKNENLGYFKVSFSLETNQSTSSVFTPFDAKFVQEIIGVSRVNSGINLSSFKIRKIKSRTDGGIILLAERYFLSEQPETIYINGIPQTSHRNIYNYEEIIILSINANGTLDWNKFINKQQSTMYDGGFFSSFITLWGKNNFYIFFNDKMSSLGNTLMYSIAMDGEINQSIILKSREYNQSIIPIQGRQIGYNRVIIPTSRDKSIKLLKVTISE